MASRKAPVRSGTSLLWSMPCMTGAIIINFIVSACHSLWHNSLCFVCRKPSTVVSASAMKLNCLGARLHTVDCTSHVHDRFFQAVVG